MSVPSLRAAATSILMARDPLRNSFVVLLVQRSESSQFMPGVHVFPGGVLDKADENPAWQSILDVSSSTLPQTLDRVVGGDCLPMRIACVRELFEEAGILLCEPPADRVPQAGPTLCSAVPSSLSATVQPPLSVSFSLKDFRSRLLTDPALFYSDIVQQRKLVPSINALFPWSRWTTPVTEKRRFDTYFYLIGLCGPPPPIQQMQDPSGEVTNPVWMSPSEALDAAKNKTIILSPPTTYVLNELQQYGTFEKLFSQVLTTRGVSTLTSTWTPRQHFPEDTKKSMLMITLPGDHQHEPATSAQAEFSPTVKFPSSSSSSTSSLTSASPCGALPLHRVVKRRGHGGWDVVLNIRPPLFGANVGEAPNLRPKL